MTKRTNPQQKAAYWIQQQLMTVMPQSSKTQIAQQ
jgi:hypothetical protein